MVGFCYGDRQCVVTQHEPFAIAGGTEKFFRKNFQQKFPGID